MLSRYLAAAVASLAGHTTLGQTRIFVDWDATGLNNGTSWPDAFTVLQDALDNAATIEGDIEMWVAAGKYVRSGGRPFDGFEVYKTAGAQASVTIIGGFDGTENSLAERAGLFEQTILSGDRNQIGVDFDNSVNVITSLRAEVIHPNFGAGTIAGPYLRLDGLTIERGLEAGVFIPKGSQSTLTTSGTAAILNCIIRDNSGTGVAMAGGFLGNSTFRDNTGTHGAAARIGGTVGLAVHTCRFIDNTVTGDGGALYIGHTFGNTMIFGSVFVGNQSGNNGGAVFTDSIQNDFDTSGDPDRFEFRVAGCTFVDNIADGDGGAIYRQGTSGFGAELGFVVNSIFWMNRANSGEGNSFGGVAPSIVEYVIGDSGATGTGNIAGDPLFYDRSADDFRLRPASPARDAGLAAVWDQDPYDWDFDGNTAELIFSDGPDLDSDGITQEAPPLDNELARARVIGSSMDMGAIECCPADSNGDGLSSPADFNAWILAYNSGYTAVADVNRDGALTPADFNAWVEAFSLRCN